jgi:trans-2,3-dihydro-3-hydroxyanthranilate isomerase
MPHKFATLDVFTDTRFSGNPLAVVSGADGLDDARMQAIAREFNLSETVFLMTPERQAHSAKMRIFTPSTELPFAGHPTVGTAIFLAGERMGETATGESLVVLEQKIGIVRVGVKLRGENAAFAEFDAPKLPEALGEPPSTEKIADALNLLPSEIGFQNHKPTRYGAGVPYTFVPVASREAIARCGVNFKSWPAAFGSSGHNAAYVYTRDTVHNTAHFHARMFVPGSGIVEDPATGSAAAAFAAVVTRFDQPPAGWHKRVIEQGFEMKRPSLISVSLEMEQGRLETVRIGGQAVIVTRGTLNI